MTSSWINKLTESDSRNYKEDILKQAVETAKLGSTNSENFLKGLYQCYNPFITFGIKQIPESVGITNAENPWDDLWQLLSDLSERKLTGNDARDEVEQLMHRFDSDEWNDFIAPILRRDMRSGISEKTINKVVKRELPKYKIPTFGCQLATDSKGRPEMRGAKRIEPKLDGVRVLVVVGKMNRNMTYVTTYSRNGKVFENFSHIEAELERNIGLLYRNMKALHNGFVLDGEIVGESFQSLMRQARRKEDVQAEDTVFHVFDILPLNDFHNGHWNAPLSTRVDILNNMEKMFNQMSHVELVPHIEVDLDTTEGQQTLEQYGRDMVEEGYEGIMIKDMGAPYECKRNKFWLKWKPTITVDLQVVGVEEGTGRNKGRLGALVCHGVDDGREITVNVGSGYSDSERTDYWENRNHIVGNTVEILADVVSQNQNGTYSLRFPRFVRFRDDK